MIDEDEIREQLRSAIRSAESQGFGLCSIPNGYTSYSMSVGKNYFVKLYRTCDYKTELVDSCTGRRANVRDAILGSIETTITRSHMENSDLLA